MSEPYIVKDAKGWTKGKLFAVIGGSALAGALIIGGTAFGLNQLQETNETGEMAGEDAEFDGYDEHEDREEGDDHEGFEEDQPEFGEDS